ncbi:MAG: hypothetical protein ABL858_07905 [Candidatus Nitrotoga sp.]
MNLNLINTLTKYFKRIRSQKLQDTELQDTDFSSFLPDTPPKQQLIEECQKLGVSIYIDDPSEQSAGVYANQRAVASEAELERRLNAKKAIMNAEKATKLSKWAIFISLLA